MTTETAAPLDLPGDAGQWPFVSHRESGGTQAELSLRVPAELMWFQGHYPDQPVLPGVVQVFWAEHFARQLLGTFPARYQLRNLKFKQMILPDTTLSLTLSLDPEKGRTNFRYHRGTAVFSSGAFVEWRP